MHKTKLIPVSLIIGILIFSACNIPIGVEVPANTPTGAASTLPPQPGVTAVPTVTTAPTNSPFPASTNTAIPDATVTATGIVQQPPAAMVITINPPSNNGNFASPGTVELSGSTNLVPFEKNLGYRVFDENNHLMQQGPLTVTGEYGGPGTFTLRVDFAAGAAGRYRIYLYNESAATGKVEGDAEVSVTLVPADPNQMVIKFDSFPNGNEFQSPATVWLNGTVNIIPFEKTLSYEVLDQAGQIVQQGPFMVTGEYGSPGTFSFSLEFQAGQVGYYTIKVLNHSAKDGSVTASAQTIVWVK